mgnify:CR=1 FL=1
MIYYMVYCIIFCILRPDTPHFFASTIILHKHFPYQMELIYVECTKMNKYCAIRHSCFSVSVDAVFFQISAF